MPDWFIDHISAVTLAVRDMAVARAALAAGKIGFSEPAQRLVVGPDAAFGATLVFEGAP